MIWGWEWLVFVDNKKMSHTNGLSSLLEIHTPKPGNWSTVLEAVLACDFGDKLNEVKILKAFNGGMT